MKRKLQMIVTALLVANGNKNWFLNEPITVRLSEMDFDLFQVYGLCVSPKNDLYVMDEAGEWNKVELEDMRADKMIDAIHQRVFKTFKYAKVA
jgi:hypothetical protein